MSSLAASLDSLANPTARYRIRAAIDMITSDVGIKYVSSNKAPKVL
jgi:hypothetical protein